MLLEKNQRQPRDHKNNYYSAHTHHPARLVMKNSGKFQLFNIFNARHSSLPACPIAQTAEEAKLIKHASTYKTKPAPQKSYKVI